MKAKVIANSSRKQNRFKKTQFKYNQQISDIIPGMQIHLFKSVLQIKYLRANIFILIN